VETAGRSPAAGRLLAEIAAGPGCLTFLWVYSALHLAHERGVDLPLASAISSIPLFATLIISVSVASIASIVLTVAVWLTERRIRQAPRLLLCSITLFGAVMVLFP
jgi:hypothetical protein